MSYYSKSTDSFNTRLRFYLFEKVLETKGSHFEPSLDEFLQFDLRNKEGLIHKYTAKYYHRKREDNVDGMLIDNIYYALKKIDVFLIPLKEAWRKRYFKEVYIDQFSGEAYIKLINADVCEYCEMPIVKLRQLIDSGKIYKKNERGWNLEIDRKNPNQEYSDDNCVAACYWCNNAKTDEFTAEEFKPIGLAIGEALKARLIKTKKE